MSRIKNSHNNRKEISDCAVVAGNWLLNNNHLLATVESCTGGGIAQAITSIAGSTDWFERGFVTYSNLSKHQLVGVNKNSITQHGSVSEPVAAEMARGGLENSVATLCLSVTGIAGPGGGRSEKPVGMVCFGKADKNTTITMTRYFQGDRQAVRDQSIIYALSKLIYL